MARIPDGSQFGQVAAQGGPMANVDPGAFGAGVAEAVTRAGNTGMQAAGNVMTAQAQEAKRQQAQADAEAKQLAREQAAEAKATAKEATRVKSLTATATVQGGLANLHDTLQADLESGTIDKAEVGSAWTERSRKLIDESLANVDPEHKELVGATLLNDVNRYGQSVSKMVTARDKKDIMAGGLSYIEQMQRHAARGPKEADEAIANVSTFWKATGPMAGEDPATAAKRVQQFTENVRFRQASDLVNVDPGAALKALKNKEYLPELDPDRRAALVANADAAVLRNQQRGALNAERAARDQQKAWSGAMSVFESGKMPTPEYADTLVRTFRGTPYAAALKNMLEQAPQTSAFVAQPVQQQAAAMTSLQNQMNQGGATPEALKKYEQMDKAHKATLADVKNDPYMAASERGVLPDLQPLSMNLNELPAQLAKRGEAARTVSAWAGQEVSLFRPAEAEKVASVLQAMPPKDRAGALAGLTKAMTPGQRIAFAQQVAPKDRALELAAGMSSSMTTAGRYTSELLLLGQQAVKDKSIKPDNMAATGTKAQAGAYLGDAVTGKARDDVLEAATLIYHGMQAEGNDANIERAVRMAVGGPIVQHNGKKLPAPAQFDQGTFGKAVQSSAESATNGQPVYVGGKEVPTATFLQALPTTDLQPVGAGRYIVRAGSGLVTDKNGKALVLEVK
jgi:hypothetical protein